MKQIIQDLGAGNTDLIDCPRPAVAPGTLVIDTSCSLISVGTERMLVDFGKASLVSKARQQPDKVRQVIEKARSDGILATIDAVRSKLAQPVPLGYSNVGVVAEVGAGVTGFAVGDRVLSNGPHAEVVRVPQNLCARIPAGVSDDAAAFGVVASIGLQGVRLANPTLGEYVAVIGTGLIGLLTVQILLANGCRVLAIDFDQSKLDMAAAWGAETCLVGQGADPVAHALAFTRNRGMDAVLITASTKSNDPIEQAAAMSRKRGRIVLVGVAGLNISRDQFYQKELSFQVSCSYGPGRYDNEYEDAGHDYPLPFVRWTEQRNFEAVLELMASGRLDPSQMISKRSPITEGPEAFAALSEDRKLLGVLLDYPSPPEGRRERRVSYPGRTVTGSGGKPRIAVIGAGNFASRMLVPALKQAGVPVGPVVTSGGLSGSIMARQNNIEVSATDIDAVLSAPEVAGAAVVTRHASHARLTARLLEAGKAVYVEKPLAVDRQQLELVRKAHEAKPHTLLMVGFNRRFAPLVVRMKELLDCSPAAKSFVMTMNSGAIPPDVWVQDPAEGGRIIGEACHYVDLMRFLAGSPIAEVKAMRMGDAPGEAVTEDKAVILLRFADGSHGAINYLANGSAAFPKERIEAFAGGGILALDNFRSLKGYGWKGFRSMSSRRQDKGHAASIKAFCDVVESGGPPPIPVEQIFEVTEKTIEAAEILRNQG